jgi:hypothetical protein
MAIYPTSFTGQDKLQPGARGEMFQSDMPGYRGQGATRINRTNMTLNTSEHDTTNSAYAMDSRLPVLFRHGYAYGFNQMVMTKGRIVALDPERSIIDFEDKKPHNVLTLANGGKDVDLDGTKWKAATAPFSVNSATGLDAVAPLTRRPANKPMGIIMRNEYTRDDDAFNGIAPGAILTDCMVELPWFAVQAKAEENPWGAIYGNLKPGDLVKSDMNGRFVASPLNNTATFFAVTDPDDTKLLTKMAEYEAERQQVVGQVYETFPELVPAGAAIYAQWALSDRENFNEFNPAVNSQNNRRGEDSVPNSPFGSDGTYPGHPYERGYMADNLHMISERTAGGRGGVYDPRLELEHQMRNGIPGLTDGYNAVQNFKKDFVLGQIGELATSGNHVIIPADTKFVFRTLEVSLEAAAVSASASAYADAAAVIADPVAVGDVYATNFKVDYVDFVQGLIGVTCTASAELAAPVTLYCSYTKRGLSGVPTNLDWDGCKGTVKVLMQK